MPFGSTIASRRSRIPSSWLSRWARRPVGPYDLPTAPELVLLAGAVIMAPVVIVLACFWVFTHPEMKDLKGWRRAAFYCAIPALLPLTYGYVVVVDVAWPLIKRARARRRVMREAERAVKELLSSASPSRVPE